MPSKLAGRITEPAVCVARARGTCASPTAAPEPDDDPPVVWVTEEEFVLVVLGPTMVAANSVVVVFPVRLAQVKESLVNNPVRLRVTEDESPSVTEYHDR